MITRITRGTVRPNCEGQVFAALRAAITMRGDVPGLLHVSVSRKTTGEGVSLVGVATWTDIEAMAAVLGSDWHEPTWLPGLDGVIVDATVEVFETIASSLEEIVELPAAV